MRPPVAPNEEYGQIVKDGLISSVLGSASMVARLLMSNETYKPIVYIRKGLAASVVAILVGLGINDYIHSFTLKLAVIGLSGFCAPEVSEYAIAYVHKRLSKEAGVVVPIKKVKPNAKRPKQK